MYDIFCYSIFWLWAVLGVAKVMKSLWHQRSYEGSMKSVPDDDLLKMLAADLDPAHVKQLDQMVLWTQELQECIIMQYLLLLPFESTKRASKLSGPMLLLHSGKGTITLAGWNHRKELKLWQLQALFSSPARSWNANLSQFDLCNQQMCIQTILNIQYLL